MPNFFDTIVPGHPNNLQPLEEYIKSHSPEQMVAEIRASRFDPNYLADLGELDRGRQRGYRRGLVRTLRQWRDLRGCCQRDVLLLCVSGIQADRAADVGSAGIVNLRFDASRYSSVSCVPTIEV
jgi:hypothetical protein